MTKLQRKLLRDLKASKGQYAALALLLALGITIFGAMYSGYQNLGASEERTYSELRFADLSINLIQAPAGVVAQVESISGVKAAIGRLILDVSLLKPGSQTELVTGRIISIPAERHPQVNDVLVERGSYFSGEGDEGVLVDRNFAEHYLLELGETLYAVIDGRRIPLLVKGTVFTPEYIWPAKSRQELMVAPGSFGVLFMPQEQVEEMFGMTGNINEVSVILEEGANLQAVADEVERALAPFGVMGLTFREDQPSYALLKLDLEGFGELAVFVPVLFLLVTAMMMYVLLTRTVHAQRAQIGLMRAVGYSRRQVLLHYLSFALLIAVIGSIVGTIAGYYLGALLSRAYTSVVHIPYTEVSLRWGIMAVGIVLGFIFCGIAGSMPAWGAARVAPAEAMRTPPPIAGRSLLIERVFPFLSSMGYTWKIPLRNLFRRRRRTLYAAAGIAVAVALMLASFSMLDAIEYNMGLQFGEIQAYDLKATFAQSQPVTTISEFQTWEGVRRVEPIFEIPLLISHGDKSYPTILAGLPPQSELYRLRPTSGIEPLSGEGLFLGRGLAKVLEVGVGDPVELQTTMGPGSGKVAGLVKEPIGSIAYMALDAVQQMMDLPGEINGAMLKVDGVHLQEIKARLYGLPQVLAVEDLAETRESLSEFMALFYEFIGIFILFALALAFVTVFNTVTVNVLERAREMATMRTLGASSRRIGLMITLENLLMGAIGIVFGVVLGYVLSIELLALFESDLFSMEFAILPRTYAIAVLSVLAVLLLSQIPGIRHINRLDLARVTKEQAT